MYFETAEQNPSITEGTNPPFVRRVMRPFFLCVRFLRFPLFPPIEGRISRPDAPNKSLPADAFV
jgi:hypothetical protein